MVSWMLSGGIDIPAAVHTCHSECASAPRNLLFARFPECRFLTAEAVGNNNRFAGGDSRTERIALRQFQLESVDFVGTQSRARKGQSHRERPRSTRRPQANMYRCRSFKSAKSSEWVWPTLILRKVGCSVNVCRSKRNFRRATSWESRLPQVRSTQSDHFWVLKLKRSSFCRVTGEVPPSTGRRATSEG